MITACSRDTELDAILRSAVGERPTTMRPSSGTWQVVCPPSQIAMMLSPLLALASRALVRLAEMGSTKTAPRSASRIVFGASLSCCGDCGPCSCRTGEFMRLSGHRMPRRVSKACLITTTISDSSMPSSVQSCSSSCKNGSLARSSAKRAQWRCVVSYTPGTELDIASGASGWRSAMRDVY